MDFVLLHNIQGTILTLLITALMPVAIFMLDTPGSGKTQDTNWDIKVILKQVLNLRRFGCAYLMLLVIFATWPWAQSNYWRVFLFVLFTIIAITTFPGFIRCYLWIEDISNKGCSYERFKKSYRNKYRNEFLGKNKDTDIWVVIWNNKISIWVEQNLIENFIERLNVAKNKNDINFIHRCLDIFNCYINERTLEDHKVFNALLNFTLDYFDYFYDDNGDPIIDVIKFIITNIIRELEICALMKDNGYKNLTHSLFNALKKYTNYNGIEVNAHKSKLFNDVICPVFFNALDKANESMLVYLWEIDSSLSFPIKWRIKYPCIKTLNIIRDTWRLHFFNWAEKVILSEKPTATTKRIMNAVINGFFPNVDPSLWEKLLVLFVRVSHGMPNPARSLIENPFKCVYMGRCEREFYGSAESVKKHTKEKKNTIELAAYLFRDYFSIENLCRYIDELNSMESGGILESQKQDRQYLLEIFKAMKKTSYSNKSRA